MSSLSIQSNRPPTLCLDRGSTHAVGMRDHARSPRMIPRRLLLLSMLLLVAGCMAEPQKAPPRPAPAPMPVRPVPPPPAPQPVPAPPGAEWQDMPLSDGAWSFSEQSLQASFGASDPSFIVRCDPRARQVHLLR